jgi:hypothetical protein
MILKAKRVNTMERFGLCSLKGCISVATDGQMCVLHSTTYDDDCVDQNRENKKRSLPLWRDTNDQATMKRRR